MTQLAYFTQHLPQGSGRKRQGHFNIVEQKMKKTCSIWFAIHQGSILPRPLSRIASFHAGLFYCPDLSQVVCVWDDRSSGRLIFAP